MRDVFVTGVGMTSFGKFPDETLQSLGRAASFRALRDAGVRPRDIEVLTCGSARSGILQQQESGVGQMIGWEVGIRGVPVYNLKAYCASGSTALNVAYMALSAGFHDIALVVGVEKMSERPEKGRPITSDGVGFETDLGFTPPAFFAACMSEHMREFGTTREQIAAVSVKNRRAAAHNPVAQYRDPISIEDVMASPRVAGDLRLLDCCPTGDGAGAVVLMSAEAVARFDAADRAVRVAASVLRSGEYDQVKPLTSFHLDVVAALDAYEAAAIGPEDIDLAEVHDAFSITEIIHVEDLGFCDKGDAGKAMAAGDFALGGRLPVSTSGGLLTKGHPLGATGTAQVVEIVEQLRGESGARQVPGAQVGLAQLNGGFMESDMATSSITILTR